MPHSRTQWILIAAFAAFDIGLLSYCINVRLSSHPRNELVFVPQFTSAVALSVARTQHYNIDEPDANIEWSKLIPSGGHLVHLRSETGEIKQYSVAMLHQFKCLDVIRQQYSAQSDAPLSPLTRHCFNYLRQSILCNLNVGLESATNVFGTVAKSAEYVCRDWSELYKAVEDNQEAYRRMHAAL